MPSDKKINILTVCGVGSGSSLILRMYVEDVLSDLGVKYRIQAGQASEAKGSRADVILCSPEFLNVTQGATARVITIKNFTDKDEILKALKPTLIEFGCLSD
jgi:PTS system ascorbate-specific IIB component